MNSTIVERATQLGLLLKQRGLRVATAESCTGGLVAAAITAVAGSSAWFEYGWVVYSNEAKRTLLGVAADTLQRFGAVSHETVRELARNALLRADADLAVAVSGIAGPTGAVPGKPVGTVWFALAHRRGQALEVTTRVKFFKGDRDAVRRKSVQFALQLVLALELPAAGR